MWSRTDSRPRLNIRPELDAPGFHEGRERVAGEALDPGQPPVRSPRAFRAAGMLGAGAGSRRGDRATAPGVAPDAGHWTPHLPTAAREDQARASATWTVRRRAAPRAGVTVAARTGSSGALSAATHTLTRRPLVGSRTRTPTTKPQSTRRAGRLLRCMPDGIGGAFRLRVPWHGGRVFYSVVAAGLTVFRHAAMSP